MNQFNNIHVRSNQRNFDPRINKSFPLFLGCDFGEGEAVQQSSDHQIILKIINLVHSIYGLLSVQFLRVKYLYSFFTLRYTYICSA